MELQQYTNHILAPTSHSKQTFILLTHRSKKYRHQLLYSTAHNGLLCLYRPPPSRRNNLTDSMFAEQLPNLLDYIINFPGFACLVDDMNIHFDNPLQSLTIQTFTTLSLYNLVQIISKPSHTCGHITDGIFFDMAITSIEID